jgi:hypothetical protein
MQMKVTAAHFRFPEISSIGARPVRAGSTCCHPDAQGLWVFDAGRARS